MIEHLFSGHAKFPAARADFQPAFFIAIVTLGEIFGPQQNQIAVVGHFHERFEFKTHAVLFAISGLFCSRLTDRSEGFFVLGAKPVFVPKEHPIITRRFIAGIMQQFGKSRRDH